MHITYGKCDEFRQTYAYVSPLQVTLGTSRPQTCRQPVHGPWSTAGPGSPLPPRWARRSGPCSARGASVAEAAHGVLRAAAPPHHEHCGRRGEGGGLSRPSGIPLRHVPHVLTHCFSRGGARSGAGAGAAASRWGPGLQSRVQVVASVGRVPREAGRGRRIQAPRPPGLRLCLHGVSPVCPSASTFPAYKDSSHRLRSGLSWCRLQ